MHKFMYQVSCISLYYTSATNAESATSDLFKTTLTELAGKIVAKNDYVAIVDFAQSIVKRVAVNTEVGTDIHNVENERSPVLFRLQTIKTRRLFDSKVKTSAVQADLLTGAFVEPSDFFKLCPHSASNS